MFDTSVSPQGASAAAPAPRLGVVGAAHWARTVHLAGALGSGAEVVGLWSRTSDHAQAAADEYGVTAFDTFAELIDGVDILTMAVPPYVQAGLAVQAARAGKHLLLDKPIAASVSAAERIRDAVRENDLACLVFHTRQFVPEIQDAVAYASQQGFTHGRIHMHYPVMTDPNSPYARTDWRTSDHAAYWELGPHVLSSSIPVLGPVVSVRAAAQVGRERTAIWTTGHAGGATCHYSMSTFADPARGPRSTFEFHGPTAPATPNTQLPYCLPDPMHARTETFRGAVGRLVDAVVTGDRTDPRGVDLAVEIVRVLEAAVDSIGSGRTVYLDR